MEVDKITSTLLQIRDFHIRFHVNIYKKNSKTEDIEHYIKSYEFKDKTYLNLDVSGFITMELKVKNDWSMDKSIMITSRTMNQVVQGFRTFLDGIYNGGVFAMNKKNEIILYSDMAEKNTVRLNNLGMKQILELKPAIVYDKDNVSYEGGYIIINKTTNVVDLSVDELEAVYYNLNKIDMFSFGASMLSLYNTIRKEEISNKKITDSNVRRGVVTEMKKDDVVSNLRKKVSNEEYFGLEEGTDNVPW